MAFDYRQFLAENKLTKVSKGRETGKAQILSEGLRINEGFDTPDMAEEMDEANKQKEDYLKRQERAAKGNWKGSIGAFVEEHGEELGNMISKNREQLKDYVENVMKPELTDEAKEKVDELLDSKKSTFGFIQSLYNFTLKGSGMGLHEEVEDMETYDDTMEESEESMGGLETVMRTLYNNYRQPVMIKVDDKCAHVYDETGETELDNVYFGEEEIENLDEAMNHSSLGGERNRKKPGVKPGTANQDKMAKSEMKGDEIEVTIGGIKKAVSQRAFNKYRKMTDPEEKKAWREKHGFDKK